ncbi:hypothetical protein JHK82_018027 [Glycine max]|nr:hypothetical protein JHK87_017968 [Glycine soja]KAG5022157.1 hypothetical protein JHK85_018499 [Glycine max]KAG5142332.1 hypothetical protein JHK82_018027 [Glycine max]
MEKDECSMKDQLEDDNFVKRVEDSFDCMQVERVEDSFDNIQDEADSCLQEDKMQVGSSEVDQDMAPLWSVMKLLRS